MIDIVNKADCCGCTACARSCPTQCITMQPDEEGFLYPQVDVVHCIGCGLCEQSCPVKHPCFDHLRGTDAYRVVGDLRCTDYIMNNTFWVGVYPGMTDEKLVYVANAIREAISVFRDSIF